MQQGDLFQPPIFMSMTCSKLEPVYGSTLTFKLKSLYVFMPLTRLKFQQVLL
ncbi:hypothetical protein NC652_030927 [Populus alba x Populus x berolinensis]|nr:hypothetical protein NC652_030927 [Populus alba x Populus x berolinensis]